MKKVGFIGGYNKIDMLLYVAKMLTIAEKRVLLVDTTKEQKTNNNTRTFLIINTYTHKNKKA